MALHTSHFHLFWLLVGSTNVRKALADVSNAQEKFTTAVVANKGVILNSTSNPKVINILNF